VWYYQYLLTNLPFCDGAHRKEKGIKKYNEFLLKSNTDLKASVELEKKKSVATSGAAILCGIVLGVAVAKVFFK
jgi:hypothetical protein